MKIEHCRRLDHFQTGIFAALNEKKVELEKQGKKIYNLSVGTPDFETPRHIMEAVSKAALDPENYKYALRDLPEMIDAVVDYYRSRFHTEIRPNEILSCHGTQDGMGHLGMALCNPGDVVLLPNPGYPLFEACAWLGGAEQYFYPLMEENDYLPRLDLIPEEILHRAKFMIVSYPSNPVGALAPRSFYEELIVWAKKYNIIIVNDNAYSDIMFDGNEGMSFLSLPGAKEVGVEFFSLSKSFNLTGARISFAIGSPEIISILRTLLTQVDFGMYLPVQQAAITALRGPRDLVRKQCGEYKGRRDALCGGLRSLGWHCPDTKGTMFVWAHIPEGYTSSLEFCNLLVEKAGVLATPGTAFGDLGEGYLRFALVRPAEELREIVEAIRESGISAKK